MGALGFALLLAVSAAEADAGAGPDPAAPVPPPSPTMAALRSGAASARMRAVVALTRAGDHAAVPELVDLLATDPDAEVRARAAWALGELHAADAEAALLRALREDPARRVKRAAALSLGTLDTARGRAALTAALQDDDRQVAAAAVDAMARSHAPGAQAWLERAAADWRPLVQLTARRALARRRVEEPASQARRATPAWPVPAARACRGDERPPDCAWRPRGAGVPRADPLFIGSGALLGGLAGAFLPDAVRPYRRGTVMTPLRSAPADNTPSALERAIAGAVGAAAGASAAAAWTLVDDVSLTRVGLVGLLTAEAVGLGAAVALGTAASRQPAAGAMLALGGAGAVGATLLTWPMRDLAFGDVAAVGAAGALGFASGFLGALVVVPAGAGRQRGREGFVVDIADLVALDRDVYRLPWGAVGRLQLAAASGLVGAAASSGGALLLRPLVEVGVTRMLLTVGAAALAAGVVALPLLLWMPVPPSPLPTPDRFAAGTALLAGAGAGTAAFVLAPNDDGQRPLLGLEFPRLARRGGARPAVALRPPTAAVLPPVPTATGALSSPGLWLGLVDARF